MILFLQLRHQLRRRILPIPLRVILRPEPQIRARILQRPLRLPVEFLVGTRRVGGEVEHVAVATGRDFVGERLADGRGEGVDHLVDGAAAAGSQVPGAYARVLGAEVVEGFQVAVCEVEDVDVVSDCCAVAGGVVWVVLG